MNNKKMIRFAVNFNRTIVYELYVLIDADIAIVECAAGKGEVSFDQCTAQIGVDKFPLH